MARAIRTDQIDFNTLSMEDSMKKMKKAQVNKTTPRGKGKDNVMPYGKGTRVKEIDLLRKLKLLEEKMKKKA